jgi:hypothetical protein
MTSVVYLWSQYVPISIQYLSYIQQKGGRTICVDHPTIRKQILSSPKIKVKQIPCVLVSSQGRIEQYEGDRAIQWLSYRVVPSVSHAVPSVSHAVPSVSHPVPSGSQVYEQLPDRNNTVEDQSEIKFSMVPRNDESTKSQDIQENSKPGGNREKTDDVRFEMAKQNSNPESEGGEPSIDGSPPIPVMTQKAPVALARGAGTPVALARSAPLLSQNNQGNLPSDITPISQIAPEPPIQNDRSQFTQSLNSYNQQAMDYYQQFQTSPPQPTVNPRVPSPKEKQFQQVLEMARKSAQEVQGDTSNDVLGSTS